MASENKQKHFVRTDHNGSTDVSRYIRTDESPDRSSPTGSISPLKSRGRPIHTSPVQPNDSTSSATIIKTSSQSNCNLTPLPDVLPLADNGDVDLSEVPPDEAGRCMSRSDTTDSHSVSEHRRDDIVKLIDDCCDKHEDLIDLARKELATIPAELFTLSHLQVIRVISRNLNLGNVNMCESQIYIKKH